jgi:hypothetical protein
VKPHEKAKAWRERRDLTREQLSDLTGYSVIAIRKLESGFRRRAAGEKHSEWVWHRYQMACAGVEAQLKAGRKFEW